MIDLEKYRLKEKYRKVLDHLNDDDKIKLMFKKYIENKIEFKEFVRYNKKVKRRLSIEKLKFEDVLFHFKNAFEDWRTNTSILYGILLVQLCDYLNVKVETIGYQPIEE